MAFVLDTTKRVGTDGETSISITFEDWFTADDGLQAGDYIMVAAANRLGSSVLSITGWNRLGDIDTPRIGTTLRSQVWWIKYDGITLPSEPTITGTSSEWVAVAWVVRDAPDVADESWIDVSSRVDEATQMFTHPIPSVTTTEPDCLVLTVFTAQFTAAFETPDNFWGEDISLIRSGDNNGTSSPIVRAIVASRAQFSAGLTPAYDYVNGINSRAQYWTIAIKNKAGGSKPIGVLNPPLRITDFLEDGAFTSASLTDLSTIHATIDGQSTFAPTIGGTVVGVGGVFTSGLLDWFRRITLTPPAATTGVAGVRWDLSSATDYSQGIWTLFFQRNSQSQDSTLGVYHYFEDNLGNWAVYRFVKRGEGAQYLTFVKYLPDETAVDGSVTPVDLANITKRGFAYSQVSANTLARQFNIAREAIQPFATPLTLIGGGVDNPITARTVARALGSGGAWRLSFAQGQGQQVITLPYQLGDGTVPTYVDDEAQALEYPRAGGILGYTVFAGRQEIRIKASASDAIILDAGIKGTSRPHNLVFDPATSTDATYGMAGTFLGWNITLKTGLSLRGGTYIDCGKIDAKGATVSDSIVKGSTATDAAMRLEDGGVANRSEFIKGAETYAIEIQGTGTVSLKEVVYTGYTTPINVLATTGIVTIELAQDEVQPAYDTAGATVEFSQPVVQATASITGFSVNSRIIIYNVTTDTEMFNDIIAGTSYTHNYLDGTGYSAGDIVDVFHVYYQADGAYATRKTRIRTIAASGGWSVLITEEECTTYETYYTSFGITGESVYDDNEFSFDGAQIDVNIDVPGVAVNWFAHRLFMWDKYVLWFTGNREFFQKISSSGPGQIGISDMVLDNIASPARNYIQQDVVQITRTDGSYPVRNPSTGGGGIDVIWKQPVLTVSTGSGVTPQDKIDIANEVWNKTLP